MSSSSYWAVVQAVPRQEQVAIASLGRVGYLTYCPRISVRDRQRKLKTAALFPGYLFARVVERWSPICACIGVVRLLRGADGPARIDDRVVADLRAREVNGLVALPALRSGQPVRLVNGSFRGHLGVYQGMNGRDRERVLLGFLGREVHAVIRAGDAVAAC